MLEQIERSGKSDVEMARKLGVSPQRIYWWRNRLKKQTPSRRAAPPAFIEVVLADKSSNSRRFEICRRFEIYIHGERKVVVWSGFDAEQLERVLAIMEKSSC
ncbi:MAG: IS66 family insertion sequence element accessory protein TnpB [Proteobacteria bacterium]|nr:IS66 family insertion sequence element accessory protein TnpB [Pseudomonadota bacterium]